MIMSLCHVFILRVFYQCCISFVSPLCLFFSRQKKVVDTGCYWGAMYSCAVTVVSDY